ncbi:hypothetical protein HMPREF3232_00460 [Fannyhessea vaginae]|nr:hypothetical protein HMPREF3232_00460 [Fannyhessea vaginae]
MRDNYRYVLLNPFIMYNYKHVKKRAAGIISHMHNLKNAYINM